MKLLKITQSSLAVLSTFANAQCVGVVVNGVCQGYENGNSSGYKSDSGTRYQYDMSNGNDRLKYSVDTDAQQRDRQYHDYSGNRQRDRSLGQYGGGIYDE